MGAAFRKTPLISTPEERSERFWPDLTLRVKRETRNFLVDFRAFIPLASLAANVPRHRNGSRKVVRWADRTEREDKDSPWK